MWEKLDENKKFRFVYLRKSWPKFYQNPDPHSWKMLDLDPYPDPHLIMRIRNTVYSTGIQYISWRPNHGAADLPSTCRRKLAESIQIMIPVPMLLTLRYRARKIKYSRVQLKPPLPKCSW
jgi:hypothetical protein